MKAFVTGGSGFVGRELIRAIVARGDSVRAIGRSEKSLSAVKAAGAEPVKGDLEAVESMRKGMEGCEVVFHCAAHTEEWDTDEAFYKVNVTGTDNVMAAARQAKVKRFVLISSEAVLADGKPLIDVDESTPLPRNALPGYPATKGVCETHVLAANGPELETVIVRPRYIWGRGDTANLVKFIDAVEKGRFAWIGQGKYLTSTTHVANVVEGALLAAERGKPGEIYFITDGKPVEFRWLLTQVLKSQHVEAPKRSIPFWLAWTVATSGEKVFRLFGLKGTPPATRVAIALMGQQVTVNDQKARRELGYVGKMSIEEGLKEMASLPPVVSRAA